MQPLEEFLYCRAGQVKIFSDASDRQVGGASFNRSKVVWDTAFKAEDERKKSITHRELSGIKKVSWQMDGGCRGRL